MEFFGWEFVTCAQPKEAGAAARNGVGARGRPRILNSRGAESWANFFTMGGVMNAALKLFADLGITYVPFNRQHRPGPKETTCINVVDRMIRRYGARHADLVLRTVADQGILVADIIEATSDLALSHPRWARSADWFTALAGIDLAQIRQAAKAANIRPRRVAIAVLIAIEVEKRLGPSRPPKPVKTVKPNLPPKPPRAETRVPEVMRNIKLGTQLVGLRSTIKGNCAFGRQVRRQFEIDAQHCCELMRVARAYGSKPEVYTRLSWHSLVLLSRASMPASVRQGLESRITAGEKIVQSDIGAARQAHADRQAGEPWRRKERIISSRPSARPAQRMAA